MKKDTSFIELTYPSNLSRICIEPKLVPIFTSLMYRMQDYFNKHNYTKNFNYCAYFKEFILSGDYNKKLKIVIDSNIKGDALYISKENKIFLSDKTLSSPRVEFILCHEFIHFLTIPIFLKRLLGNKKDEEWQRKQFIIEALTESLSMQIYPEYSKRSGYSANVRMVDFYNKLSGSINHYQSFLLGHLNFKIVNWWKKTPIIEKYENDFHKFVYNYFIERKTYCVDEATSSYNYQSAQRSLVLGFLEAVNSFVGYFNLLNSGAFGDSPIKDNEFFNNELQNKEKQLIDKLNIENINHKNILLNNLVNLRNAIIMHTRKTVDLPFKNGFIYLFDNTDYITYGKGSVRSVNRYFNEGVYTYRYNVDGIEYTKVVDKNNEYQNLMYYKEMFYGHLNYILANNHKVVHNSRKS